MNDSDIVIIGAGLTGLRAALEVSRSGLSVLVVEGSDSVGGRMRTSNLDGLILDHGFQVLLTAYPELASIPSIGDLNYGSFMAGARVRIGDDWLYFTDPRRQPREFIRSLRQPIASISDLIKFGWLSYQSPRGDVVASDHSTARELDQIKFSGRFQSGFIKPFLRGVLLDPSLNTDSGLAKFYLKTFSRGSACLPASGIQALPELIADSLGRQHIMLSSKVINIRPRGVTLESGDEITARYVICACDALGAAALGGPEQTSPHSSSTTLYFLAEEAPYPEPMISLIGDGSGPINNLAVLTNAQPSYATGGRALISATVIGSNTSMTEKDLLESTRRQFHQLFGAISAGWEFVKAFSIPNSVPARPRISDGWLESEGIYYAGDYLSYGSQNGALKAGRLVGQEVCRAVLG
jgi:phytoene dehydrogenase-like protein